MTLPQSSHMTIHTIVQLFRPIQPINCMLKLHTRQANSAANIKHCPECKISVQYHVFALSVIP